MYDQHSDAYLRDGDRLAALEAAIKARQEEAEGVPSEIDPSANDKIAALTNVVDKLKEELAEAIVDRDKIRDDRANRITEVNRELQRVRTAHAKIDSLNQTISTLNERIDELTLVTKDLIDDNHRLTAQIAESGERLSKQRRTNQGNVDRVQELEAANEKLREQLSDSEQVANCSRDALARLDAAESYVVMLTAKLKTYEEKKPAHVGGPRDEEIVLLDSISDRRPATKEQVAELLRRVRLLSSDLRRSYELLGTKQMESDAFKMSWLKLQDDTAAFKAGSHRAEWVLGFFRDHRDRQPGLYYRKNGATYMWVLAFASLTHSRTLRAVAGDLAELNVVAHKLLLDDMPEPADSPIDQVVEKPKWAELGNIMLCHGTDQHFVSP